MDETRSSKSLQGRESTLSSYVKVSDSAHAGRRRQKYM